MAITGSVGFPGLYAGEGIDDLIRYAGGLCGRDSDNRLSVLRGCAVPQVVELTPAQWHTVQLRDGDRVEATAAVRTEAHGNDTRLYPLARDARRGVG